MNIEIWGSLIWIIGIMLIWRWLPAEYKEGDYSYIAAICIILWTIISISISAILDYHLVISLVKHKS